MVNPLSLGRGFRETRGAMESVVVGASPFTYTVPRLGQLIVAAGTVTTIELSRDSGATWTTIGLVTCELLLSMGDQVKVTYAVLPTMFFLPV